jgi:hypothetical protein
VSDSKNLTNQGVTTICASFVYLQALSLHGCTITAACLVDIAHLSALQILNIGFHSSTRICDPLAIRCEVDDVTVASVAFLLKLKVLFLHCSTDLTAAGLSRALSPLVHLRALTVENYHFDVTNPLVAVLSREVSLSLLHCVAIEGGAVRLARLPRLRFLKLGVCAGVSVLHLTALSFSAPRLERIGVHRNYDRVEKKRNQEGGCNALQGEECNSRDPRATRRRSLRMKKAIITSSRQSFTRGAQMMTCSLYARGKTRYLCHGPLVRTRSAERHFQAKRVLCFT